MSAEILPVDKSPSSADLLAEARRDLPAFYANATPDDVALMDALFSVQAAIVAGQSIPREPLPPVVRLGVEETAAAVLRSFADLRAAVRGCQTYQGLDAAGKAEVERIAFAVKVPPSN